MARPTETEVVEIGSVRTRSLLCAKANGTESSIAAAPNIGPRRTPAVGSNNAASAYLGANLFAEKIKTRPNKPPIVANKGATDAGPPRSVKRYATSAVPAANQRRALASDPASRAMACRPHASKRPPSQYAWGRKMTTDRARRSDAISDNKSVGLIGWWQHLLFPPAKSQDITGMRSRAARVLPQLSQKERPSATLMPARARSAQHFRKLPVIGDKTAKTTEAANMKFAINVNLGTLPSHRNLMGARIASRQEYRDMLPGNVAQVIRRPLVIRRCHAPILRRCELPEYSRRRRLVRLRILS